MNLNENITKYRNTAGETQGQLAELLGVSNRTVSKWENAEGEPDVAAMMKIAEHYGVTLDELCGFEGKKAEKKAELSPNEVALRAFSESFDVLKRLRTDISEGEDNRFVPPSLLKEEYQTSGCRTTGVFTSRIWSLFVNSRENNMALTLLRNRDNFAWLDASADELTKLLGYLADPDIRRLAKIMLTDTFPYHYTAEFAAEKAGIPAEKAEEFLEYAVYGTVTELLEGTKKIYTQFGGRTAGLILAIFCCAYEITGEPETFEIYNANVQPIMEKKEDRS